MHAVFKFGFYSSLLAATAVAGFSVVQVLQVAGVTTYPLDAILIYSFSLCIAPPFMLAMLSLHYSVPVEKKFWSHAALLFAILYNAFILLMYVVQLATVIPYNQQSPVLVVTPHSFFWTIDAIGYICMGLSILLAVPVFAGDKARRPIKYFFLIHGLLTPVIAVVYFYPSFSLGLLLLASPWSITATGCMLLLALYFNRLRNNAVVII